MKLKNIMLCGVCGLSIGALAAVPSLKGSAEAAGTTGLKIKALQGSKAVQAITPKAQHWNFRRGDEKWQETHFDVKELWQLNQRGAAWRDRKGNELLLAMPSAFLPVFEKEHAKREDIEGKMKEDAETFKECSDETLSKWVAAYSGKSLGEDGVSKLDITSATIEEARSVQFEDDSIVGVFFKAKNGTWYYAQIKLIAASKVNERAQLVKKFLAGVTLDKAKAGAGGKDGGMVMEGKWITLKVPGYLFKTDLPKSQALAFVKSAGRMMEAMQAAYQRYVPPVKDLKLSTVRVFSTREGYNDYMKSATGESGERTIGLWSPGHEELLVLDQGNSERGETLKTMRHEAFHQYLFYASAKGDHAMWYNEGHACFFENVIYDAKKNYVRIYDDPKDRRPQSVAEDPEKIAKLVPKILHYDHDKFYSGSLQTVNDNYTAAWALVYFLEKGSHAFKEFAEYQAVLPTYLKAVNSGESWEKATDAAWEKVAHRDFEKDFLRFWGKRNAARNYEPSVAKTPTVESEN